MSPEEEKTIADLEAVAVAYGELIAFERMIAVEQTRPMQIKNWRFRLHLN